MGNALEDAANAIASFREHAATQFQWLKGTRQQGATGSQTCSHVIAGILT